MFPPAANAAGAMPALVMVLFEKLTFEFINIATGTTAMLFALIVKPSMRHPLDDLIANAATPKPPTIWFQYCPAGATPVILNPSPAAAAVIRTLVLPQ